MRKKKDNLFFEVDAIKSYVLGFLYADGHVCKNGNEISLMIGEKDYKNIENIIKKTGDWSVKKDTKNQNRRIRYMLAIIFVITVV